MNLEKTCRFKKVSMNICNHPEQKVLSKLNFFRFMGRFQKMQKKIFLTPPVNIIHQNHTAVLQLSYREIFIFLNILGKDFTPSLTCVKCKLHDTYLKCKLN